MYHYIPESIFEEDPTPADPKIRGRGEIDGSDIENISKPAREAICKTDGVYQRQQSCSDAIRIL